MKQVKEEINLVDAFKRIEKEIQNDEAYAYSWHSNIAMALYDEMPDSFWFPDKSKHLEIANKAAARFMMRAFNTETSQDMLDEKP